MTPRPFEQPATIGLLEPSDLPLGSALEGLWLPPSGEGGVARGGAVMAAPHPLMGGSMESPVATEVALAVSDAGYGTLRFNWRGVGASAGSPSGEIADADADYAAAVGFVEESVDGVILSCGYSWGALAASRMGIQSRRARKMILVAPPPMMLDAEGLASWGQPILVIAGDSDSYVPIDELREKLEPVEGAELIILEGVDHFFMAGLADVGHNVRNWLNA